MRGTMDGDVPAERQLIATATATATLPVVAAAAAALPVATTTIVKPTTARAFTVAAQPRAHTVATATTTLPFVKSAAALALPVVAAHALPAATATATLPVAAAAAALPVATAAQPAAALACAPAIGTTYIKVRITIKDVETLAWREADKLAAAFSIPRYRKMPTAKLRTELHREWMQRMPQTTAIALQVVAPSRYLRLA